MRIITWWLLIWWCWTFKSVWVKGREENVVLQVKTQNPLKCYLLFSYRNQIPKGEYHKAVRQLRELQRRHSQFKSIMQSANVSQAPLSGVTFLGVAPPTESSTPLPTVSTKVDNKIHIFFWCLLLLSRPSFGFICKVSLFSSTKILK